LIWGIKATEEKKRQLKRKKGVIFLLQWSRKEARKKVSN
jgi:hypothetical protein